jgi:microsomal dipeptidase-like Zn-dependent dipeptidase
MTSAAALAAETDREAHTLARYLRHLEHIIGIDHVILGLHYTEYLHPGPGFLDTKGLEDASASRNIIRELFAFGCTQEDVEKIAFRNFMGIFEEATSRTARP